MAEICHLENRHDVIFFCRGWSDWIKFCRLVQDDMSTVVIWLKSKPGVKFQYGRRFGEFNSSQSNLPHCWVLPSGEFNVMIPELRITLQGAATWWIHFRDSIATCYTAGCSQLAKSTWLCHIAGCNKSIRHIENRFSPYFIFFCFLMQFGLWRAGAFVSFPIHLFLFYIVSLSCFYSLIIAASWWNKVWKLTVHSRVYQWVSDDDLLQCIDQYADERFTN